MGTVGSGGRDDRSAAAEAAAGSSTTTTKTTTNPLVGTWNPVGGGGYLDLDANGTGSISDGHPITSWTLSSTNVLHMTIPQEETSR